MQIIRLSEDERNTIRDALKLIQRSPDIGEGWRQVTEKLWPVFTPHLPDDLVEFDESQRRVRMNDGGHLVLKYI